MCEVIVGRWMVFASEERIEQMKKREGRGRREQKQRARGERNIGDSGLNFFSFTILQQNWKKI